MTQSTVQPQTYVFRAFSLTTVIGFLKKLSKEYGSLVVIRPTDPAVYVSGWEIEYKCRKEIL